MTRLDQVGDRRLRAGRLVGHDEVSIAVRAARPAVEHDCRNAGRHQREVHEAVVGGGEDERFDVALQQRLHSLRLHGLVAARVDEQKEIALLPRELLSSRHEVAGEGDRRDLIGHHPDGVGLSGLQASRKLIRDVAQLLGHRPDPFCAVPALIRPAARSLRTRETADVETPTCCGDVFQSQH